MISAQIYIISQESSPTKSKWQRRQVLEAIRKWSKLKKEKKLNRELAVHAHEYFWQTLNISWTKMGLKHDKILKQTVYQLCMYLLCSDYVNMIRRSNVFYWQWAALTNLAWYYQVLLITSERFYQNTTREREK